MPTTTFTYFPAEGFHNAFCSLKLGTDLDHPFYVAKVVVRDIPFARRPDIGLLKVLAHEHGFDVTREEIDGGATPGTVTVTLLVTPLNMLKLWLAAHDYAAPYEPVRANAR